LQIPSLRPVALTPELSRPAFSLTEGANMDVIGSVPLALGVLIALGGILVTMSYLSE
jgi:hypothetical protein